MPRFFGETAPSAHHIVLQLERVFSFTARPARHVASLGSSHARTYPPSCSELAPPPNPSQPLCRSTSQRVVHLRPGRSFRGGGGRFVARVTGPQILVTSYPFCGQRGVSLLRRPATPAERPTRSVVHPFGCISVACDHETLS